MFLLYDNNVFSVYFLTKIFLVAKRYVNKSVTNQMFCKPLRSEIGLSLTMNNNYNLSVIF